MFRADPGKLLAVGAVVIIYGTWDFQMSTMFRVRSQPFRIWIVMFTQQQGSLIYVTRMWLCLVVDTCERMIFDH